MPKNSPITTLRVIAGEFKGRKLVSPRTATTHPMGAREKNALFNMIDVRGKSVLDAYAGSGALGIEALSRGARQVVFVENDRRAVVAIRQNLASLGCDFRIARATSVASAVRVARVEASLPAGSPAAPPTAQSASAAAEVSLFAGKVTDFVRRYADFGAFDVIIADPPYDKIDLGEIASLSSLLTGGGVLDDKDALDNESAPTGGSVLDNGDVLAGDGDLSVDGSVLVLSSSARQPAPELAGLKMTSSHTYAEARVTVFEKG